MRIKIKPAKRQWLLQGLMMGLTLLLCACGQGSSAPEIGSVSVGSGHSSEYEQPEQTESNIVPQGGDWTTGRIEFSVSADGSIVESFEVSYSGRASNENCDFDYSDVATVSDLQIKGGLFEYVGDELQIFGTFKSPQEAEVIVYWFGYYGGACEIHYNGELTEVALLTPSPTD